MHGGDLNNLVAAGLCVCVFAYLHVSSTCCHSGLFPVQVWLSVKGRLIPLVLLLLRLPPCMSESSTSSVNILMKVSLVVCVHAQRTSSDCY